MPVGFGSQKQERNNEEAPSEEMWVGPEPTTSAFFRDGRNAPLLHLGIYGTWKIK